MRRAFMKATTYTVGNFKGGVGKTKIVTMLAYDNALIKKKRHWFWI